MALEVGHMSALASYVALKASANADDSNFQLSTGIENVSLQAIIFTAAKYTRKLLERISRFINNSSVNSSRLCQKKK
jgi:hypothetical protein